MEGTSLVPTEDAQLPAPAVPRPVPDAHKEFPIWETVPGEKQVVGSVCAPGSTRDAHGATAASFLKHESLKDPTRRLGEAQLAVPWPKRSEVWIGLSFSNLISVLMLSAFPEVSSLL